MPWITRRTERRVSSERRRGSERRADARDRSLSRRRAARRAGDRGIVVRLTKREQEIKALIATGLGNKEIARRLNIATNTVKSHVHNMLGKLGALTTPDRRRSGNRRRRGTSRRSYQFSR
ncbi:MAG: hypothetical protein DMD59_07255 [Gemmatimonadetes bacterium]|nr:MAG: hypothetical protein DMD59_07255 [Gemmatimonadota bacterium]